MSLEQAGEPSPVELALVRIWEEVLGIEPIAPDDNFFELGGDSVLAIDVMARARSELEVLQNLSVVRLFENQTIRKLAALATAQESFAPVSEDELCGPLPLTPVLAQEIELEAERLPINLSIYVLESKYALTSQILQAALEGLVRNHEALRLQLRRDGKQWQQQILPIDAVDVSGLLFVADCSGDDAESHAASLEATKNRLVGSVDVAKPPLLRAALCTFGPTRRPRLMLAVHHWASDVVSTRILLEDLQRAYEQLDAGRPVQLPVKTTGFRTWARKLQEFGQSAAAIEETRYWKSVCTRSAGTLRVTPSRGEPRAAQELDGDLSADETQLFLRTILPSLRVHMDEALLAMLALAHGACGGESGMRAVLLHNGRVNCFKGLDVGRTMGWFTMSVPMVIDLTGVSDVRAAVRMTAEQLRSIPNQGIGYGVLRYMNKEPALSQTPEPDIRLNNQGDMTHRSRRDFEVVELIPMFNVLNERIGSGSTIDVRVAVWNGKLVTRFRYPPHLYDSSTMEALRDRFFASLRSLLASTAGPQ